MTPPRIFRLFLSSTFSDFIAEREALQNEVIPQLEEYCAERGARFQAIDLRWGITEEAQENRETLQICLEEVRRCQELSPRPNFAILLGHRYGWEPIPERIPENHWQSLVKKLREQGALEDIATLKEAYRPDSNSVPTLLCLQPNITEPSETAVQNILRRGAADFVGDDRLPYFASATHQEIAMGALGVPDAAEHVHAYIRRINNLPSNKSAKQFIDWDDSISRRKIGASEKLQALESQIRDHLTPDHVHDIQCDWASDSITDDHLGDFCDRFVEHQKALIDQELTRLEKISVEQSISFAHCTFAKERSEIFVGREPVLHQISDYLNSPSDTKSPLIVTGFGGAGKTSIIAKSYLQTLEIKSNYTRPIVLCRFVGGVPGVESLRDLLASLTTEICRAYDAPEPNTNSNIQEISATFIAALRNASTERPLYIFVDAIDQLEQADSIPLSDWLQETLPDSVRFVLSSRTEGLSRVTLDNPNLTFLKLKRMKQQEGDKLLSEWLAAKQPKFNGGIPTTHSRTLTDKQRELLLETFKEHGNPLWLKLGFEEARKWHSWQTVGRDIEVLPPTVAEMTRKFIRRYLIEQRKHSPIYVRRALSYLAASRYGLSEDEVAIALARDKQVRREFQRLEKTPVTWKNDHKLPPIFWSRLYLDLRPYLATAYVDGALVYRFFHREFQEVVSNIYRCEKIKKRLHLNLAQAFSSPGEPNFYKLTDASESTRNSRALRRVMEQPWQLAEARQGEKLRALLMDFRFCMAKCAANRSADLIQDYIRANEISSSNDTNWHIWSSHFIGRIGHILLQGNESWPAHRILLQLALEHADDSPLTLASEKWLESHQIDWPISYVNGRPSKAVISGCRAVMSVAEGPVNNIEIIGSSHLLAWSSNQLGLWDFKNGRCLQAFEKMPGHITFAKKVLANSVLCVLDWKQCLAYLETGRIYREITDNEATNLLRSTETEDRLGDLLYRRELLQNRDDFGLRKLDLDELASALYTIDGFESCIDAKYLPDGRILSLSDDGILRVWDGYSGNLISELKGHKNSRVKTTMLSDGRLLSWDDSEGCVRIWSIEHESARITKYWDPDTSNVTTLPDGRIFSWSATGRAMIWDSNLSKPISILDGHSSHILGVRVLKDGTLITFSKDATIRYWDPIENEPSPTRKGHSAAELSISAIELPNGNILSYSGSKLILWDGRTLQHLSELESPVYVLQAIALEDGNVLFWGTDGSIRSLSSPDDIFIYCDWKKPTLNVEELTDKDLLVISDGAGKNHTFNKHGKKIQTPEYYTPKQQLTPIHGKTFTTSDPKTGKLAIAYRHNITKLEVELDNEVLDSKERHKNKTTKIERKSLIFSESIRTILYLRNGSLVAFSGLHRLSPKFINMDSKP